MSRNRWISLGEWVVIAGIVAIDVLCANISHIPVAASSNSIIALAIILGLWPVTAALTHATGFAKGSEVLAENAAKFFVFIAAASALEYYCAMSALPLNDGLLVRIDGMFGFSWPDFFDWVKNHTLAKRALTFAYFSLMYEAGLVLFLVSIFYPQRARRFPTALIVSGLLTIPFLWIFPVEGPFLYFSHADAPQAFLC